MTPQEFDELMERDQWTPTRRAQYRKCIPLCDVQTFYREMSRPDGMIEVKLRDTGETKRLRWTRFFRTKSEPVTEQCPPTTPDGERLRQWMDEQGYDE